MTSLPNVYNEEIMMKVRTRTPFKDVDENADCMAKQHIKSAL